MHCAVRQKSPDRTRLRASRDAAFTLIEIMVASVIIAIFMSGMFALNSQAFQLLRSSQGVVAAEQCTRDRLDKMRNAAFDSMVDPTYIRDTVLATTGNTFPPLSGMIVTIDVTINPRPSVVSSDVKSVSVTRNASGTASIVQNGDGTVKNEKTVMVTTTVTWAVRGVTRTHQGYTLITPGGISGRNH